MKKVAIIPVFCEWVSHFETDLEIAQRHMDKGDKVTLVLPEPEVVGRDIGFSGNHWLCNALFCSKIKQGIALLKGEYRLLKFSAYSAPPREDKCLNGIQSIADIKSLRYGSFDVGYAVLSSLISKTRDPELDIRQWLPEIKDLYQASIAMYNSMQALLKNESFDAVYCFNGRYATVRPIYWACREAGVDCGLHERGHDQAHFEVYWNHLPHDRAAFRRRVREAWNRADPATREQTARQWFEARRKGVDQAWYSFVNKQEAGRMPEDWCDEDHNIVVFTSSEDEFLAIGKEWESDLYKDQVGAVARIAKDVFTADAKSRIWVRLHPNMADMLSTHLARFTALERVGLCVIAPEAPISSYGLIDRANVALCFGSTVGIEATFWGKPSVLAGVSFYSSLDVVYEANTHEDLIELLLGDTKPKKIKDTLPYGHYFATFGTPYKFYQSRGFKTSGTFRGQVIRSSFLLLCLTRLARRLFGFKVHTYVWRKKV